MQLLSKITLVTGYWLLVTGLTGCGYTVRSGLRPDIRTITIPIFVNKIEIQTTSPDYRTYYPGLEIKITNAIIERFIYDGNLRIAREEEADLVLAGELIDYARQPLRYSEADEVEEYRLTLNVKITLKNKEADILWQEENFFADTTYHISGPLTKTEAQAINDIVKDLARRIVNRTVEEW
jgi:outer membrane lipopolysaccharide assembly protein LptE/RlpB